MEVEMQDVLESIYKETDKLYYEAQSVYDKWMTLIAERELQRKSKKIDT